MVVLIEKFCISWRAMHEDQLPFFFSNLLRTPIEQDYEIEAVPLSYRSEPSESQSETMCALAAVDVP
jgi:hypothetical protein